jgi:hypothetical protein
MSARTVSGAKVARQGANMTALFFGLLATAVGRGTRDPHVRRSISAVRRPA